MSIDFTHWSLQILVMATALCTDKNNHFTITLQTVGDIFKLRKDIYRSARDEFFDNVSALLFGVVQLSPEEEELVAVILSK